MISFSLPQIITYAIVIVVIGFGLGVGIAFAKKLIDIMFSKKSQVK